MIDDIFLSLGLDKCEWLEDIEREDSCISLVYVVCRGVYVLVRGSLKLNWLRIKCLARMLNSKK